MTLAIRDDGPADARGAEPRSRAALVVDDDPYARRLAARTLAACGIADVREAHSVDAARAALAERDADLLICDLAMPGEDGIELLRGLGAGAARCSVIVVSAHDGVMRSAAMRIANEHGCRMLGALAKPMTPAALAELIDRGWSGTSDRTTRPGAMCVDDIAEALFNGRVEVHYQPIVDQRTGRTWGFECLARLRDTTGALLGPASFVAAAEGGGLADALLEAVLDAVCRDAPALTALDGDGHITINLASRNLDDPELPQHLERRLAAAGIAPSRVVLELTESQSMHADPRRHEVLTRLRLRGFGLAIDDFGTGWSTIERLRDIPFTELKVDRGFVAGVDGDPVRRAILEHSASLGRSLGLRVVAEGVERPDELAVVGAAGCALVQGYLFSRPLALPGLVEWSRTGSAASSTTNAESAS